jgi:threonine dehydrogenase-like Zn-dependent dehydrogenase
MTTQRSSRRPGRVRPGKLRVQVTSLHNALTVTIQVPFAEVNLLPVPDEVSDEKALYLSDILPTVSAGHWFGAVLF